MTVNEVIAIVLGFLLRLGVPIVLTAVIVILLKRLDARWQAHAALPEPELKAKLDCWKLRNCPEATRTQCRAYASPEKPCWQVFRAADGRLQERCLLCEVFRQAPSPTLV